MIIDDIIQLRKGSDIDFGETYAQLLRHFKGSLRNGCLEWIQEDGELKGFVDWVRLPEAPAKRDFGYADYLLKGDWVYIITICAKEKRYFWELVKRVRKKEGKKGKHLCYHRQRKGVWELKIFRNIKEENYGKGSESSMETTPNLIYQT